MIVITCGFTNTVCKVNESNNFSKTFTKHKHRLLIKCFQHALGVQWSENNPYCWSRSFLLIIEHRMGNSSSVSSNRCLMNTCYLMPSQHG